MVMIADGGTSSDQASFSQNCFIFLNFSSLSKSSPCSCCVRMFLHANNEARRKIFVPVDESSVVQIGHDGVAESGTINPAIWPRVEQRTVRS